ncbi:MAG: DUF4860 domain-containing protein [Eggerthellaceae bacterium]|nr:DUF4860 domain-containing protein [Eggerthellaceae bacterium]
MDAVQGGLTSAIERGSGRTHEYGRVFTALLFALFVITLLLAIMAGTRVYSALSDMRTQTDDDRLAMGLLVNSVRADDAIDAVSVGAGPEGPALVLTERLNSGSYETRIYLYQGQVVQEYSVAGTPYTPDKATPVVRTDTFTFTYSDGLLSIVTDEGTADVALRSVRGGA